MGFSMPPVLTLVGMLLAAVALLLQIVGVATPAWRVWSEGVAEGELGLGLFKACGNDMCVDLDKVLPTVPDWFDACRACGILAVLLLVGCLVVAGVTCFMQIDKVPLPLIAAVLAFVAAISCLVEFAVFVGKYDFPDQGGLGYSFALTVTACVMAAGSGIFFILGKIRS